MAIHQPVIILTDLDNSKHPTALIEKLLGKVKRPEQLIIRVAVREIESWVLSDRQEISKFLGSSVGKIPEDPDSLPDPKATLLGLAKKAPREVRADLVAQAGTIAKQGVGYNRVLVDFIRKHWCPTRASENSRSLRRAISRIQDLANRPQQ